MSQEEVVDITRTLLGHLSTHPLAKVSCKPPPLLVHFLTTFFPTKVSAHSIGLPWGF